MATDTSLGEIVSGRRMVERFTKRGLRVAITWYEVAAVLALTNQSAGLAFGYFRVPQILDDAFGDALIIYAAIGLLLAAVQIAGLLGAWTALITPKHTPRLVALYLTLAWLASLGVVLVTGGLTVGAGHLLIFSVLAAAAAHNVAVNNGHAEWRP